jgi:hypothetical protein
LSHFLVLINNLSKQILSLHILHFITAHFTFITAHFTFITAQIGYHCTLKLGMFYRNEVNENFIVTHSQIVLAMSMV